MGPLRPLAAGLAVLALLLFLLGIAGGWATPIAAGLACFGAEYALFLATGKHVLDERSPLVAVGLVLAAELAFWSLERAGGAQTASLVARRLALVAATAVGAGAIAALLLVVSGAGSGGVGVEALGVLAAATILLLLARLTARSRHQARVEP